MDNSERPLVFRSKVFLIRKEPGLRMAFYNPAGHQPLIPGYSQATLEDYNSKTLEEYNDSTLGY